MATFHAKAWSWAVKRYGFVLMLALSTVACERLRATMKARAEGGAGEAGAPVAEAPPPSDAGTGAAPKTFDRKAAWLSASLTGRDNAAAAFRLAQITTDPQLGFRLFIKNQFKLACALTFDATGRPSEAKNCKGEWRAKEPVVRFTCEDRDGSEVCRGRYTLTSPDGFSSGEVMEIVRPTGEAKAGGAPAVAAAAVDCKGVCAKLASCKKFFFDNEKLDSCTASCEREANAASVPVATKATFSNQASCFLEAGRTCADLVMCGSVRSAPR